MCKYENYPTTQRVPICILQMPIWMIDKHAKTMIYTSKLFN